MTHILIIRLSAIGDVALTVPVIDTLARLHPSIRFTVLSQHFLAALFARCPSNVTFLGVHLQRDCSGILNILRLHHRLKKQHFSAVADLHDVLRTKLLRLLFRCSGTPVRHINKGRREKRRLIARQNHILQPLPHTTERYLDVFRALGLSVAPLAFRSIFGNSRGNLSHIQHFTGHKTGTWIGVAPLAKHPTKTYPLHHLEQIIAHFASRNNTTIFIFGVTDLQNPVIHRWTQLLPSCISVHGHLPLSGELILISHLNLMLSMDSANMHLASLTATPVISIWGATHPFAGFTGYRQSPANSLQIDLSCRPCSIYGNRPCHRHDIRCMHQILPQTVIRRCEELLADNDEQTVNN